MKSQHEQQQNAGYLDRKVSRYRNHHYVKHQTYPLGIVLKEIREGRTTLHGGADDTRLSIAKMTHRLRGGLLDGHPEIPDGVFDKVVKMEKLSFPAFIATGIMDASVVGTRNERIRDANGLILVDFDGVDAPFAMTELMHIPHVLAAWTTLSGKGVAVILPVDPIPQTKDAFRSAYATAVQYLEHIGEPDTAAAQWTQRRALVHDPHLYVNENAKPVQWVSDEELVSEVFPKGQLSVMMSDSELPDHVIERIYDMDIEDDSWHFLGLPCLWNEHEHDVDSVNRQNRTGILIGDGCILISCRKCGETRAYRPRHSYRQQTARGGFTTEVPEPLTWLPEDSPIFRIAESLPNDSQPYRGFLSPEERELAQHILQQDANLAYYAEGDVRLPIFTTQFPFGDGHDEIRQTRRLFALNAENCPVCDGRQLYWMDRYLLTVGSYCEGCKEERQLSACSWAAYQWNRRPADSIISQHSGYIAEDPALMHIQMWQPKRIFHLGSGMGTGKTYHIFRAAEQLVRISPTSRVIYLGARVSQVQSIHADFCRDYAPGYQQIQWGLFHEGSDKPDKVIGTHGAIATISSLSIVMDKIADDIAEGLLETSDVHLVIDEIDFGVELMNASIMKDMKEDNKVHLMQAIASNGIVVAGQTENLLSLEAFATEMGIKHEDITGYYMRGDMQDTDVRIFEYPNQQGMRGHQLAVVMQRCREVIESGKLPYVFCQGRRTAQVIASHFPNALVYDAYEKGDKRNMDLLELHQAPEGTSIVVTSCAVDVGISIGDPNAYSITVIDVNVRYHNGVASSAQQLVRDRMRNSREVHVLSYNNRLPATPTFYIEKGTAAMRERLHPDEDASREQLVVEHLAKRKALNELSDVQMSEYLTHHLEYAGFNVILTKPPDIDTLTDEMLSLKDVRKSITRNEQESIETRASAILQGQASCWQPSDEPTYAGSIEWMVPEHEDTKSASQSLTLYNEPLADTDIRKLGVQQQLTPSPWEQLSHEYAWQACQAVGFTPISEYELWKSQQDLQPGYDADDEDDDDAGESAMTMHPEQLEAAIAFVTNGIVFDEFRPRKLGYLGVHHPDVIETLFNRERGETTHRLDYRLIGLLLKEMLEHIPLDKDFTETQFCECVRLAIEERYGDRGRYLKLLRGGEFTDAIAVKFQFYHHTEDVIITDDDGNESLSKSAQILVDWASEFLQTYYPCIISVHGSSRRLNRLRHWKIYTDCIQQDLLRGLCVENSEAEHSDLIPVGVGSHDFHAQERARAKELYQEGELTLKDIAKEIGKSISFVSSAKEGVNRKYKAYTAPGQILEVLSDGEIHTSKQIAQVVDAKPYAIKTALSRLVREGRIQRMGHGKYRR